jgi:hypothetical protein
MAALQRLRDWPLHTKNELPPWYEAARDATILLTEVGRSLSKVDFHFLMHWLSDADIRLKDSDFARLQNERLHEVLGKLANRA